MHRSGAERRARRLVRWYPKQWRLRYGAEFTQLLADDIHERPRSWRRTLDVAQGGLTARVTRGSVPRSRLAIAAVIFVVALAGAAVLHAVVDPNQEIRCPAHITRPLSAKCLIVPGHGWVNSAALSIAVLGVATAFGLLLAAALRPRQRRIAGAVAILVVGVAVALWVATYRHPVPAPYPYPRAEIGSYPSPVLAAVEALLIGFAVVGVALAVLLRRRPPTRLRLATVLFILAAALAAALIPHVIHDPAGFVDCNFRGVPYGGMPGCPRVAGPVWLNPAALALGALAVAGAAGLLVAGRRRG